MSRPVEKKRLHMMLQIAVIALLVAAYAVMGAAFHVTLRTDAVCSHIAYIPIVLAGMWWGRRAILVAVLLGLVTLSFHLFGIATGRLWVDMARVAFFVGVAFCVGMLSEKVMAGRTAQRLSEEKYRLIVDKALAGMFIYRDDKYVFVNSRYAEMIGYPPEELIGRGIWEVMVEEDQPRVKGLALKRKEEGFSDLQYECRIVTKGGKIIWVDVASSAADYEGLPAVLVNVYDITDRKEAEQKRQELSDLARKQEEQLVHSTRLAELGEMAAAVAHELNQPLTGIRNFARNAYYMLDKNVGGPEEVKDNLRMISEQVDRAARIINQMRELTRRTERQFARVDMNGVIRECVEFLMPQLRLSGVEVRLDLAKDLPEIMGDRIRLEQVLLNLVTNARQAMEMSEQRRLTIRTRLEQERDCPVVTEISDTGKGFSRQDAAKLFTPFFSTKKVGHGTGLGLSISMSIVKDHKGTIEAAGEPGKGATFTVRLPIQHEEKRAEASAGND